MCLVLQIKGELKTRQYLINWKQIQSLARFNKAKVKYLEPPTLQS